MFLTIWVNVMTELISAVPGEQDTVCGGGKLSFSLSRLCYAMLVLKALVVSLGSKLG